MHFDKNCATSALSVLAAIFGTHYVPLAELRDRVLNHKSPLFDRHIVCLLLLSELSSSRTLMQIPAL
jgi:hypothetical protein